MKTLIVGAGAAGMMAAAVMAESGADVCLVEKNSILGRKVIISGGGRCNITTANSEIGLLMKHYPRGGRWLRFAMHEFDPEAVYRWFEDHGIPLKTEVRRIFPRSNKGTDVTEMFGRLFEKKKVEVLLRTGVDKVEKKGSGFRVIFKNGKSRLCDKLILTTGGHAYRNTGSSGDGYAFAQALGHNISELAATLTSFSASDKWVKDLAGVSVQDAKLKMAGCEFTGPILFTHKGVTGPGIFALSSLSAFEKCSKEHPLKLSIDFVPNKNYEALTEEIYGKRVGGRTLLKVLNEYVPKSILAVMFGLLGLDGTRRADEVSKKDINRCVEYLKNLGITLIERSPGAEIVTAGGVDLKEVDQKTMQSKICPGLYFAGELLDVDGFTGGYNLQIAWATGRLAGVSALDSGV